MTPSEPDLLDVGRVPRALLRVDALVPLCFPLSLEIDDPMFLRLLGLVIIFLRAIWLSIAAALAAISAPARSSQGPIIVTTCSSLSFRR